MASRPFLKKVDASIEKAGKKQDMTGVEYFLERIKNGDKMLEIAKDHGTSRTFMYTWMNHRKRKDCPTIREDYTAARKDSAHSHAEDALIILDGATSDTIAVDRERASHRRWLAGMENPKYGDKKESVTVNIAELSIQALRVTGGPIPEAEVEVLETVEEPLALEG